MQATGREPSMEEILASIRRIIEDSDGGKLFEKDSPFHATLVQWIKDGAKFDEGEIPQPTSIEMEPKQIVMAGPDIDRDSTSLDHPAEDYTRLLGQPREGATAAAVWNAASNFSRSQVIFIGFLFAISALMLAYNGYSKPAAGLVMLLAGCGDGEEVGEKPDLPDETPVLWNPCDVLDARLIEQTFGTVAEEDDGEPTLPECRFAPDEETGQPVVTANYSLFTGTLDEAWDKMGQPEDADVREPRIPEGEAARIVVAVGESTKSPAAPICGARPIRRRPASCSRPCIRSSVCRRNSSTSSGETRPRATRNPCTYSQPWALSH